MPRRASSGRSPDWDALYEIAASQAGYFTTRQAATAGYSPQLLQYYLRDGQLERWGRGVFRLVHFPASPHEELAPTWLWCEGHGVFGLETALAIHELSDALPAHQDLLVPAAWRKRRLRPPKGVRLSYVDVPAADRTWIGPVLVTTPLRTIRDAVTLHVNPELVEQAVRQGVRRRLFTRGDVRGIRGEAA